LCPIGIFSLAFASEIYLAFTLTASARSVSAKVHVYFFCLCYFSIYNSYNYLDITHCYRSLSDISNNSLKPPAFHHDLSDISDNSLKLSAFHHDLSDINENSLKLPVIRHDLSDVSNNSLKLFVLRLYLKIGRASCRE